MSESGLPGLSSAPWGASPGLGVALVSAREEGTGASPLGDTSGSLEVSICRGSDRLTCSCPVCMGQTHPVCTSCGDNLGAAGVWSSCLFGLFTAPGRVLLAELERRFFPKPFSLKPKQNVFYQWERLEKCVNFNIISMVKHIANKKVEI